MQVAVLGLPRTVPGPFGPLMELAWLPHLGPVAAMSPDQAPRREPAEFCKSIEAIASHRDRQAFMTLFDHYAPRVKSYLIRSGTNAAKAEELAQETMLAVWKKAALFDATRASPGAWIFAIARNLRIDALRRETRGNISASIPWEERDEPDTPDQIVLADERDRLVRDALKSLSADQVRVVQLSFFEGQPHGEIARSLGIPLGTVKSRLRLALDRLRNTLSDLA